MLCEKNPVALGAIMLCALPLAAEAAPTVSWSGPTSGQTISGRLNPGPNCQVSVSGARRVEFFIDSIRLNTATASPWGCAPETSRYANGTHTLKAVAYDSSGASRTASINVTIQNGGSSTPPDAALPAPTASSTPNVWFKSPVNGSTLSGTRSL